MRTVDKQRPHGTVCLRLTFRRVPATVTAHVPIHTFILFRSVYHARVSQPLPRQLRAYAQGVADESLDHNAASLLCTLMSMAHSHLWPFTGLCTDSFNNQGAHVIDVVHPL